MPNKYVHPTAKRLQRLVHFAKLRRPVTQALGIKKQGE